MREHTTHFATTKEKAHFATNEKAHFATNKKAHKFQMKPHRKGDPLPLPPYIE